MNPKQEYFKMVSALLSEIKLKSLCLPKNHPPKPEGCYTEKPHGVEFYIRPQSNYILLRNIIYKLQEENYIKVLDETEGDFGYEGTRFIILLKPTFEQFYNLHEKGEKISRRLENKDYWVQANFQGNEIHFFIGLKKEPDGEHVHLILGTNGDIRVDKSDKSPEKLLKQVLAITTKEGETIEAKLNFTKKKPLNRF